MENDDDSNRPNNDEQWWIWGSDNMIIAMKGKERRGESTFTDINITIMMNQSVEHSLSNLTISPFFFFASQQPCCREWHREIENRWERWSMEEYSQRMKSEWSKAQTTNPITKTDKSKWGDTPNPNPISIWDSSSRIAIFFLPICIIISLLLIEEHIDGSGDIPLISD